TLKDLNQAYFTEIKVKDLSLNSSSFPAPLKKLDIHLIMNGKKADIDQFDIKLGNSDLSLNGYLSDLPAVLHHTNKPVTVHLDINSKNLDIAELTNYSKKDSTGIDEKIEDLSVGFSFKSSAKALTESNALPKGEFFIDSLHAQLKHYPHKLHDFHADVLIDDRDLKIVGFKGYIDNSDFNFNGLIHDYSFWMQPQLNGDVDVDITLHSKLLKLEDVFSYQGENYVPKEYRHEEFDNLTLHVNSSMHYKKSALHSIDIDLDKLTTKMHVHPMPFKDFRGRIHVEDDHLMVQKFHGQMGRTVFNLDMNFYLGNDSAIKKRDNYLGLNANYIDLDQLSNFNLDAPKEKNVKERNSKSTKDLKTHTEVFNVYELPFTDMTFDINIDHLIKDRIDIKKLKAELRTTKNHYLYIDTLSLGMAGGQIDMSGYFNGSDPKHIYMKPNLNIENVDVDKLLFKFENFGQDAVVSENLHGQLTTHIDGNIRVYPDLVPDLDQSEIHMDVEVLNGRLVNYEPMLLLSDYFGDKDLTNLRFDTLKNHIDITNGLMTIPAMKLETTLGHFEVSGTQHMNDQIEYFIRVPWKFIGQGVRNKIFGSKKTKDGETGDDEIIEVEPGKRVRYLNLKISGTIDDYKIRPGKAKKKKS
ncbi:MAG: AsmA-like C-terminal region-containing protein, partial [Vicingaceae bacterium]|nr:AsmA-like C-terminal region-containing protein [Vicingaceae bacterium]